MIPVCNKQGIHYHALQVTDWGKILLEGQEISPETLRHMRQQGTPEGMDCIFQFTPEGLAKFWDMVIRAEQWSTINDGSDVPKTCRMPLIVPDDL